VTGSWSAPETTPPLLFKYLEHSRRKLDLILLKYE